MQQPYEGVEDLFERGFEDNACSHAHRHGSIAKRTDRPRRENPYGNDILRDQWDEGWLGGLRSPLTP